MKRIHLELAKRGMEGRDLFLKEGSRVEAWTGLRESDVRLRIDVLYFASEETQQVY